MSIEKVFWKNIEEIQKQKNITDREIDRDLPQLWNGHDTFFQMKARGKLPSGIMIDWIARILKIEDYSILFR